MKRVILHYKEHDEFHLVLLHIQHMKRHSGSGSGFVSKFSFLHNFINSAHMLYDTSNESCAQRLYFLHLRSSSIYGDVMTLKLKKADFLLITVISSHRIMCNASIESFIQAFISFSYTDKFGAIYGDVVTKKHQNLMIYWCFQ